MKWFIPGNVPSSKNGRRWTGKFFISSKATMKYRKDCENIIPEFESYEYNKKNPGVEIKLVKNGNKIKKKPSSSSD